MSFPFKKWVWLCWFKLSKHKGCSILTQPTFNLFKSFNKQHDLRMSNCVITRLWCTTWTLEYKRIEYWLLVAIHLDTSIWAFLQIAFPQINCQKVQIDKYTEANWWTAKTKIKRSLCVSNAVFNAIYRQNIKRCIFQSAETDLFHLKSSNQSGWLLSTTILLFDMVVFKFIVTKIICTCFIVSPYYKKAIVNAVPVLPERQQKQCRSNNHTAVLCHWPPAKLWCSRVISTWQPAPSVQRKKNRHILQHSIDLAKTKPRGDNNFGHVFSKRKKTTLCDKNGSSFTYLLKQPHGGYQATF